MGILEESFAEVNSFYQKPHCTTEKQCKHQFWQFNSFLGVGRYCCGLKTDAMRDCDKNCNGKD